MATWTDIDDARLEPGKPARSVDALALRDNPIAIAEGAADAPRIQTAAFAPPEAGTRVVGRLQNISVKRSSASGENSGTTAISAPTGLTVLVPGIVRVTYTASISRSAESSASSSAYIAITKNGAVVSSRSASGTTSVDISVVPGDYLSVLASATATSSPPYGSASASASSSDVLVQNSTGNIVGV